MDEFKYRAGEKFEAFQVAAKTAADNGKTKVHDVVSQTTDSIKTVREAVYRLWNHEFVMEVRARSAAWAKEAIARIRLGAPPLSPVLLYKELVELFHDRVWRRSMLIFTMGVLSGGAAGALLGMRLARRHPAGPHARALLAHSDQSVILVDDAVSPGAGTGEVLIRVQAFSVTTEDRGALRGRGHMFRSLLYRGQVTVGRGFAGVVLDVGHGVLDLEMGDEVWGCVTEWNGGAATELLTIRSTRVSKRPRALGADLAAALPWSGGLALSALRSLAITPDNCKDKRVAICGASSGEGSVLLQLLSVWGAHVSVVSSRQTTPMLRQLGSKMSEVIEVKLEEDMWTALEGKARQSGPWDCVLACSAAGVPPTRLANTYALIKATAYRRDILDLRPGPMITDRLPLPFALIVATSFHTYRILRWLLGCGTNTDWMEDNYRLREGLDTLTKLVEAGTLTPVLDKVYLPQDFESALAHACSEDALGTTVIRFP